MLASGRSGGRNDVVGQPFPSGDRSTRCAHYSDMESWEVASKSLRLMRHSLQTRLSGANVFQQSHELQTWTLVK